MKYVSIAASKNISSIKFLLLITLILFCTTLTIAKSSEDRIDQKLETLVQAENVFNNAEEQEDGSYNLEVSGLDNTLLGHTFPPFFSLIPSTRDMRNLKAEAKNQFWKNEYLPSRVRDFYESLEHLSLPRNANGIESKVSLVLRTTHDQTDLMRSFITLSFSGASPINVLKDGEVIRYSFYEIFANKMNSRDFTSDYRRVLKQMRLAIMNAFPRDVQDFMDGQAIDNSAGRATLGLYTEAQRYRFVNEIIEDFNKMADVVVQEAQQSQRIVKESVREAVVHNEATRVVVSEIRERKEFATDIIERYFKRSFHGFTSDDFMASLFEGRLSQIINQSRRTMTGLTPARYAVIGGAVVAGAAYFTTSTVEASEVESSEDEDVAESNVHIYINMTEEELQSHKDRIASDRELLLYEQERDAQRSSGRPRF